MPGQTLKKAIREETAEFRQKANISYLSFSEKGIVGMRLIVSNGQNGNTGGKQVKIMNNSNFENNQKYQLEENSSCLEENNSEELTY